jgi:hypothetical protein
MPQHSGPVSLLLYGHNRRVLHPSRVNSMSNGQECCGLRVASRLLRLIALVVLAFTLTKQGRTQLTADVHPKGASAQPNHRRAALPYALLALDADRTTLSLRAETSRREKTTAMEVMAPQRHDELISIIGAGAEGRWRGRQPASKTSMITMRQAQCGQGWSKFGRIVSSQVGV